MKAKIKVCGMKEAGNISELSKLEPDFIGFIFYPKSKRYVGMDFDASIVAKVPASIKKVGVFVNADFKELIKKVELYGLDLVQLHGDESPDYCRQVKEKGINVIKAFSVDSSFDFNSLIPFETQVDYFLFDTKGENYGGNGVRFEWNILENYRLSKPFFLSGGIGVEHLEELYQFTHNQLYAIDVNSKFELSPGMKDLEKLKKFLSKKS